MPKSRRRKRETGRKSSPPVSTVQKTGEKTLVTTNKQVNRPFASPRVTGAQSLLWPVMVALGCWGMAISFFVFYNDPNHNLYGGMAVLMALLWSFSVYVRVRKLNLLRRKS
jgi:hypothetical protein